MKKLKKDLQALTKEFDVLTSKTKELKNRLKKRAVDQFEKAQAAVTPQAAARQTAKALKSLTKTMERIIKAAEKFEKDQAARKPKPKAKTRARAETTAKASAKKKASASTATDEVIKIIKRSKKGVDVPALMKKTGFDEKKVRNIVSRAFKQGKIKRAGRGIYVGA
jgi:hypothetical protein